MLFGTMNESVIGKSTGDFIHKELNQKEKMILSCDMAGIGSIFYDASISKIKLIDVSAICGRCFKKKMS